MGMWVDRIDLTHQRSETGIVKRAGNGRLYGQMSESMEKSISWLEKLLKLQGLETQVSSRQTTGDLGDDSDWLTIDTEPLTEAQIDGLIGDRAQVLDAIQYLANTILNMGREPNEQRAYTIEINGYRQQRQAELKAIGEAAAEKVIANGEEYEIKGLSAAERRQIHSLLGDYEPLETFSRGREPNRHLVVKLAGETNDDEDAEGEDTDAEEE